MITFAYAALNILEVFIADIQNAYLLDPLSEKDFIICGSEFRSEKIGKRALIIRHVYYSKVSGRDFRNNLRHYM